MQLEDTIEIHRPKTKMTMENNHLKMYFLLKMGIFQLVMLVFGGVHCKFGFSPVKDRCNKTYHFFVLWPTPKKEPFLEFALNFRGLSLTLFAKFCHLEVQDT